VSGEVARMDPVSTECVLFIFGCYAKNVLDSS
jgi:hypothetical protein